MQRAIALAARDAAAMTVEDVMAAVGASAEGLTDGEVESRTQAVGRNVLPAHRASPGEILARQLHSPLLVLLLVAAVLSAFVGERADAVIIGLITVASVGLGFVNEYRAEQASDALHSQLRHRAVVRRDGSSPTRPAPSPMDASRCSARLTPAVQRRRASDLLGLLCNEATLDGHSAVDGNPLDVALWRRRATCRRTATCSATSSASITSAAARPSSSRDPAAGR